MGISRLTARAQRVGYGAMWRMCAVLTNAFPLWVLAGGALALWRPSWVTWFTGEWITWGLAVIMLGMGLTLRVEDFRAVAHAPGVVGLGFGAQYLIMPALGWGLAQALQLPPPYAVGLILVACCPGGTASNVVTFLARGRLALSVLMTMVSTLGAVLMTPYLTKALAGTLVPVPAVGLLLSTAKVVLAPVLLGLALHHGAPRAVKVVLPVAPLISVITIALICASIIGSSAAALRESGARLLLAVVLLHSGGFGLGYLAARLARHPPAVCRTVSIEVGMQNSGLGAVLARTHFADPLTALPAAFSATVHSVIGSLLAGWWRWRGAAEVTPPPGPAPLKPSPAA